MIAPINNDATALVLYSPHSGWDTEKMTQTINTVWDAFLRLNPSQNVNTSSGIYSFSLAALAHIGGYIAITAATEHVADLASYYFMRPNLVIEARYTNWYDQLVNSKSRTVVQLALQTGMSGFLSFWSARYVLSGNYSLLSSRDNEKWLVMAKTIFTGLACSVRPIASSLYNREFDMKYVGEWTSCMKQPISPALIRATALTWAAFNVAWKGYPLLAQLEFPKATPEDIPIFNSKVQATLDTLVKTTGTLKKKKAILQNLLLYGPPGTGKTMLAKFIAKNSEMNYVMISGGTFAQHIKMGDHVTELNNLFIKAKNSKAPTILFIDEAESLCRHRSYLGGEVERIELLNAFLNWTGENNKHVMMILATNRIEDLDPAVLNRMDYKLQILSPGFEERKQILKINIARMFTKEEVDLFDLDSLAKETEGLSGRNLVKMLNATLSNKTVSADGKLTPTIIADTSQHFIEQEKTELIKKEPETDA